MSRTVAVLAGGVGAARYLRGLLGIVPATSVTAVVNTGDDTELHGLSISPDIDTITYTLSGAIDPERGWGLAGETWRAMDALQRYAAVRPSGSAAAPTWFNLGDQDLATHFYRTARLAEGATPTDVTAEIARAWGLELTLLPMTDQRFRTVVELAGGDEAGSRVSFQDYFVRLRHGVPVSDVRFEHDDARLTDAARATLSGADTIVIAPSNPLVSIGPIRALTGVDELLAGRRDRVVAVSPIVGGAALKGPADRMLVELGHEASVVGVARLYRTIARTLVIDHADAHLAEEVRATGMDCVVTDTVMSSPEIARSLAARRSTSGAETGQRIERRPASSDVQGDQPRWMRARTGDSANRWISSGRAGAATEAGPPAPTSVDHRSRSVVCSPVPTLITSPLPRPPARTSASTASSMKSRSRVWRPSPVSTGGRCSAAAAASAATTPPSARWRGPYTVARASAVNSTASCSR
jgi:LPPG:FO 2-phospho-L-lactate transferase